MTTSHKETLGSSLNVDESAVSDVHASGGQPLLRVAGLDVRYSPDSPLIHHDLSLQLHENEFMSLVGPSGCGKTTLLKALSGLIRRSAGTIYLGDRLITLPVEEMVLVFQDYSRSLLPWLTVRRNVGFPLVRRSDISKTDKKGRIRQALSDVGLADVLDKYPWQLSGGMQQRVAIARALVSRPPVLLLDEPFASVDAMTRESLEDLVLELRSREEQAVTVLLVTHDISEAVYMSDRVLVLSEPPTSLLAELPVPLERPREQVKTRSDPVFLSLVGQIHNMVGATKHDQEGHETPNR